MDKRELDDVLERHKNIEWATEDSGEALLFRNTDLAWYMEDPCRSTRMTIGAIQALTEEGFLNQINKGFDVEGITRVTGYFAKVRGFNPGKMGEVHDRVRTGEDLGND